MAPLPFPAARLRLASNSTLHTRLTVLGRPAQPPADSACPSLLTSFAPGPIEVSGSHRLWLPYCGRLSSRERAQLCFARVCRNIRRRAHVARTVAGFVPLREATDGVKRRHRDGAVRDAPCVVHDVKAPAGPVMMTPQVAASGADCKTIAG